MKPKYAILVIAFITSVVTGVFLLPSSSYADSAYDNVINNASGINLQAPHNFVNYHYGACTQSNYIYDASQDWSEIFNGSGPSGNFSDGTSYSWGSISLPDFTTLKTSWASKKYWGVTVPPVQTPGSNEENTGGTYAYIWWSDGDVQGNFVDTGYGDILRADAQDSSNPIFYLQLSYDCEGPGVYVSYHLTGQSSFTVAHDDWGGSYNRLLIFFAYLQQINYPSGYAGVTPSDVAPTDKIPFFGYSVFDDGMLKAIYLRNLESTLPTDTSHGLYSWSYNLYQTGNDYNVDSGTLLDTEALDFTQAYQYKVPSHNYYVLKISLTVTPPGALRPDIKSVTFHIDWTSGAFISGSTELNDCDSSGVCQPSSTTCNYGDVFQQMDCNMQRQLSLGAINPSITAFKNLFLSLVVPDTPTCSIPLSNITISSGKVFPLSTLGPKACDDAASMRSAFPVIAILVNFGAALALFYMVVRIINRLLNKDKNDLIEGV